MIPRLAAAGLLLTAASGCRHLRHPGETGFRDSLGESRFRDSQRDTGTSGVGDDYFPLENGWSWTYSATDGGVEHRQAAGNASFGDTACQVINEWNSSDTDDSYDESSVYYTQDVTGVSLVGSEHADPSDSTLRDSIIYDPPLFFVPEDPSQTPNFSTVGTVHLLVTAADGSIVQDSTIDWSLAGAAVAETIGTTAGTFDGYRITYTPGAALGFVQGIGLVDMGSGRLLTGFERGY